MKIIFLNKFQKIVNRGAETFVNELSKRLSKVHDVKIISEVSYLKLLSEKFDVIIPTNGRLQVFLVRLISWMKGAKMVISGQSGAGLDDRINLYTFPNVFVALSTKASNWAKKVNPFVKVVYIPNGVDLKKFKPNSLPTTHHTPYTILSVGAFTKEKRHDLTIEAVAKLQNVNLMIVGGGGDLENKIRDLGIKMLGKDRFEIRSVRHEQMPEIYKKADVLAFPTVPWESFGIVLVEAMASGLPVVATDDPIRTEIVGDAGILVDPTNTDAYAKALQKALESDWGDKPHKQAEKFNWDNIAKSYEKLFAEL